MLMALWCSGSSWCAADRQLGPVQDARYWRSSASRGIPWPPHPSPTPASVMCLKSPCLVINNHTIEPNAKPRSSRRMNTSAPFNSVDGVHEAWVCFSIVQSTRSIVQLHRSLSYLKRSIRLSLAWPRWDAQWPCGPPERTTAVGRTHRGNGASVKRTLQKHLPTVARSQTPRPSDEQPWEDVQEHRQEMRLKKFGRGSTDVCTPDLLGREEVRKPGRETGGCQQEETEVMVLIDGSS